LFDDNSGSRLILTSKSTPTLEVRDISNFGLVKSIDLPTKQIIHNIDPESGYLLLTDSKYAYVMDLANSKLKLKVVSTDYKPKLFNNRLFTQNGFMLDISKYLSK
jgi:hypothetical protein